MKYIILGIAFLLVSDLQALEISGRITDAGNSEPLTGASVRIVNSHYGAYTNSDGYFTVKGLSNREYEILVSMIGYKNKTMKVQAGSSDLNIMIEEQPLMTSEIIVSANKRVQAVQEVPISVSVIDARTMNIRNITKLEEAIRYVPGVEVNQDNISIRGSSGFSFGIGSRAALLVDGFPLIAGDNGDVEFEALPLYNVERIEVVKGAGSALYGSSALGGVINVITAEPKAKGEFKTRVYSGIYTSPKYSEWEYTDNPHYVLGLNANYSKKINKFGFNIGGSFTEDQSYQDYRDESQISLNSKINYDFNDLTSLYITSNLNYKDRADWVYWKSLSSATIPPDNTDKSIRLESSQFAVYSNLRHIFNDSHFMNFKAGVLSTSFSNTFSKDDEEYRQSDADNANIELQMNSNISDKFLVTYGLNYLNNSVNSTTYGKQLQQIFSSYAQGEYKPIDELIVNLGGRFDYEKASDLKGDLQISPKLGVSYKLNDNSGIRFSAGSGFRAPAVAERYASVNFQGFEVIANTDLLPERSFSIESGYNYEGNLWDIPIYIDAALFNNEFFDLIEPGFMEGEATIQFRNLTRARISGAEAGIKTFLFGFLGLETSLTAMNPVNIDSDEILKYRSQIISYSRMSLFLGDFMFNMDYRFKSKVKNIDERLGLQIKDHDARVPVHILDLSINYDLKKRLSIPIKITLLSKNILDYYYSEIPGNLAPTRYVGLQLNYGGN